MMPDTGLLEKGYEAKGKGNDHFKLAAYKAAITSYTAAIDEFEDVRPKY